MNTRAKNKKISVLELVLFALIGAIMFVSKLVMEFLPNIHLLGALTMVSTIVFRKKALIPIYLYVFLNGLYSGFSLWWMPYLYIWTILWGITMILPKKMPKSVQCIVYPLVCSIHGFLFGILYAPAEAIMWGLNLDGMLAWIIAGIPFDLLHGFGNLVAGLLIVPLSDLMKRLLKR